MKVECGKCTLLIKGECRATVVASCHRNVPRLRVRVARLEARLRAAREMAEFYGDGERYIVGWGDSISPGLDSGSRARAWIKEHGEC